MLACSASSSQAACRRSGQSLKLRASVLLTPILQTCHHLPLPQFLRRHVRMEDVRRYLADALIMYGSLVEFPAAPRPGAVCYSGRDLLPFS